MTWLPQSPLIRCIVAAIVASALVWLLGNGWAINMAIDLAALAFVLAHPTSWLQKVFGGMFLTLAIIQGLFAVTGATPGGQVLRDSMVHTVALIQLLTLFCDMLFVAVRRVRREDPALEALARKAVGRGW